MIPVSTGFPTVALSERASIVMGQSPPGATYNEAGDGTPFLQGKAEFGDVVPSHSKWTTQPLRIAPEGSTLVSVRAPVGDANVADKDYCIGRGLCAVVAGTNLDAEFLFYWIRHSKSALEAEGTGSTFKAIRKSVLTELAVPDVAIAEQRVIAHVLGSVQRAKEAAEQVVAAVRDLKKSLMRHVFSHGPVGVAEASDAPAWDRKPLSEIVDPARPVRRGIDQPGPNVPDGVPIVNLGDIADGRIMTAELKRTSRDIAEKNKRSQLRTGDVLISIRATAGRVAVVPEELDGIHTARGMARISPADWIDSGFVGYFMQSEEAQMFLESSMRGVALRQVNLQDLRTLSVPVPPRQVQEQIASNLRAIDNKLVAEEARCDALATVFDSLLHDLMTARLRVTDLEVPA